MKKLYIFLTLVLIAAAAGTVIWWKMSPDAGEARISIRGARISDIRSMVELSSLEIYEEIPVRASIGRRHLVAKETLEGSVGFELDSIRIEERGDTLFVTLPPEKIMLRESTRPGAYAVIDTWNDSFFGSDNFTTAEENSIKRRAIEQARRNIYAKGYVRQARATAAGNLRSFLQALTGRQVVVIDPNPEGTPE